MAAQTTVTSLLSSLRRDEPSGWESFVRGYAGKIYAKCRSAGLDPNDAKDILQEVFYAVHRAIPEFKRGKKGAFRRWLSRITDNKIVDFHRARGRQPQAVGGSAANQRIQTTPSSDIDKCDAQPKPNREVAKALMLIRDEVEDNTWKAFWFSTVDGLSAKEIADRLGISRGAVYTATWRVKKLLRAKLEECEAVSFFC